MPRPRDDQKTDAAAWTVAREFAPDGVIEYIDKGFSPDRKYLICRNDERLLLRLSDAVLLSQRETEFERIGRLYSRGLPVAEPLSFEVREDFCCGLYRYIEGESGEVAVPEMSEADQAAAGWEAGRLLRRLHEALEPSEQFVNEAEIRGEKFRQAVAACEEYELKYARADEIALFIENNLGRLESRPVVFRHGDYHPANLIFQGRDLAGVIDFNRCDFGDPYDDFYKLAYFAAPRSALFASGLIAGYFEGVPPDEFWPLYNIYVAAVVPSDLSWCVRLFPSDLEASWIRVAHILTSHDFIEGGPPSWWVLPS